MKAARLHEDDSMLHIEEVESPQISQGEALIEVLATGLCRTDLKLAHGFLRPTSYPHILGHEIAGRVVDVEPSNSMEEAAARAIGSGQTVLVHFYVTCSHCKYCLAGRSNLCPSLRRLGFELPGGFAEFCKAPLANLVPTSLGEESAVLTDAGATVLHALKRNPPEVGAPVVVMGIGGLGSFAVQLASLMGAEVIALDVREESLSMAERMGAKAVLNVKGLDERSIREDLASLNQGGPPDLFLDLVGNDLSQRAAVATLAPGGKLMQIGYSDTTYKGVAPKDLVYREIQIIGSLASTMTDLRDMVRLVESGRITIEVAKRNLDDVNEAMQHLEQNRIAGRVVIVP